MPPNQGVRNSRWSLCAYIEIQFAAPAPLLATLKRSVNVMILLVMWPPALHPIFTSFAGSATPIAITASVPVMHVEVRLLEVAVHHVAQELVAVARAAAIVRTQHRVALRRVDLDLGREAETDPTTAGPPCVITISGYFCPP